jgi:hypothetical protein
MRSHRNFTGENNQYEMKKNSATRIAAIVVALLLPVTAICQDILWKEGRLVLRDGLEKQGLILDKEWSSNPVSIEFKAAKDGPVEEYRSDQISEFSTSRGVRYKAMDVSYDGDSQNLNSLPYAKEPTTVIKGRVLLRVLVEGKPSLLLLHSSNRNQFFLEQEGKASELIFRHYGPRSSPETDKRFIQQLTLITNGCPDVQVRLKSLRYTETALVNIIKQINVCRNNEYKILKTLAVQADRVKPNFGIAMEGYLSYVEFRALRSPYSDPNVGFAVFTEVYSKRKPNTLSFYGELSYRSVQQNTDKVYYYYGNFFSTFSRAVQIKFDRIKLTTMVRLSRPTRAMNGRIFCNIGLTANARRNTVFEENVPDRSFPEFKNQLEFGIAGGIGYGWLLTSRVRLNTEIRGYAENWAQGTSGFIHSNSAGVNVQLAF